MDFLTSCGITLLLLFSQISGVAAADTDIIGIIVAGLISLACLSIVITFIAISCDWSNRFNNWMRQKGKVRMPKQYFTRKREEAKRRLLAESAAQSVKSTQSGLQSPPQPFKQNGILPSQPVDRGIYDNVDNLLGYPSMSTRTSWVQGWNQTAVAQDQETLDATMVLGDEQAEEEFRIETVIVDNEVLDVGPYKVEDPDLKPVKGDVYSVPYIFSADGVPIIEDVSNTTPTTEATPAAEEITHVRAISPSIARESALIGSRRPVSATLSTGAANTGEMFEISGNPYSDAQKLDDMVVRL